MAKIADRNGIFSLCTRLFIGSILCTLCSCNQDKTTIIAEKTEERVRAFRIKKTMECRNNLLREASAMADSLLLQEAQQQLNDSLSRSKPFRPAKPTQVLPIDSLPVAPIIKN